MLNKSRFVFVYSTKTNAKNLHKKLASDERAISAGYLNIMELSHFNHLDFSDFFTFTYIRLHCRYFREHLHDQNIFFKKNNDSSSFRTDQITAIFFEEIADDRYHCLGHWAWDDPHLISAEDSVLCSFWSFLIWKYNPEEVIVKAWISPELYSAPLEEEILSSEKKTSTRRLSMFRAYNWYSCALLDSVMWELQGG